MPQNDFIANNTHDSVTEFDSDFEQHEESENEEPSISTQNPNQTANSSGEAADTPNTITDALGMELSPDPRNQDPEVEFVFFESKTEKKRLFPKVYVEAGVKFSLVHPTKAVDELSGLDFEKGDYKIDYNLLNGEINTKIEQESADVFDFGCGFKCTTTWSGISMKEGDVQLSAIEFGIQGKFGEKEIENCDGVMGDLLKGIVAAHPGVKVALAAGWVLKGKISGKVWIDAFDYTRMKDLKKIRKELEKTTKELDQLEKDAKKTKNEFESKKKEHVKKKTDEWKKNNKGKRRPPKSEIKKWNKRYRRTPEGKQFVKKLADQRRKAKEIGNLVKKLTAKAQGIVSKMSTQFGRTFGKHAAKAIKFLVKNILSKLLIVLTILEVLVAVVKIIRYWDHLVWAWDENAGQSLDDAPLFGDVPEKGEELSEDEKELLDGQQAQNGGSDGELVSSESGGNGNGENENGSGDGSGSGTSNDSITEELEQQYPAVYHDVQNILNEVKEAEIELPEIMDKELLEEYENLTEGEQEIFNYLHKKYAEEGEKFSEEDLQRIMDLFNKFYDENGEESISLDKATYIKARLERVARDIPSDEVVNSLEKVMFEPEQTILPYKTVNSEDFTNNGENSSPSTTETNGSGTSNETTNTNNTSTNTSENAGGTNNENLPSGGGNVDEVLEIAPIPLNPATTANEAKKGEGNTVFERVNMVITAAKGNQPDNGVPTGDFSGLTVMIAGKPKISQALTKGVPFQMFGTHTPSGQGVQFINMYAKQVSYANGLYSFQPLEDYKLVVVDSYNNKTYVYWYGPDKIFKLNKEEYNYQLTK